MKNIPLFGLGTSGKSPNVSDQRRTNLYCEIQADAEKNTLAIYPTPGLTTFVNFGANPCRGVYVKESLMYVVNGSTLWKVDNAGTKTALGTLLTVGGRVDMADNGTQLMIVDGTYGYTYNFNTLAFAQITDVDFPGADTVTFMNGYLIVNKPNSGQFWISDLYDATSWNALNFATAESDPDNLVRVMADSGVLLLFGDKTLEAWGDSGAVDFPFARIGSSAIEWGLAARWSLAKFDNSLMFLRKNRLGQVQVCRMQALTAQEVSTPDLDYIFSTYSSVSDATGFSYMYGGHPFYQINFPTANASWLYDGLSNSWSQLQYSTAGRHRGEIQANFLNKPYVSDYSSGKIYLVDQNSYTDDGTMIVREFIGRHQADSEYFSFSQIWLEMEAGNALQSGQGSNPQLMMQISRDGGHTWGAELWADIGMIGQYTQRAMFTRLGRARDWLFKFRVTDPIKTVFIKAYGR